MKFIQELVSKEFCDVAIATGGFDTEAAFKLKCCGIELDRFPHATSSDTVSRQEIIPLAAKRAGRELDEVIYFGDAPWDAAACASLGIPMIGIGRRIGELSGLGVVDVFRDFRDKEAIVKSMHFLAGRV